MHQSWSGYFSALLRAVTPGPSPCVTVGIDPCLGAIAEVQGWEARLAAGAVDSSDKG
jgi:hypothetical protein